MGRWRKNNQANKNMGTGIYGTKYNKSGLFGLEIEGHEVCYCPINKTFKEAIETAGNLADEGNRVKIVCTSEAKPVIVDIYSKQY